VSTPQRKFSAKVAETLQAKAVEEPGKSVLEQAREIGGKVWDASKPMFDHGSAEVASALFNGHAHVPYGWSQVNEGEEVQAPKAPEKQPEPEQEQDGLSL
jgi:hypothetical protein